MRSYYIKIYREGETNENMEKNRSGLYGSIIACGSDDRGNKG